MDASALEKLLARWYDAQSRGENVSLQDLCKDQPELLPPLQQQIEAQRILALAVKHRRLRPVIALTAGLACMILIAVCWHWWASTRSALTPSQDSPAVAPVSETHWVVEGPVELGRSPLPPDARISVLSANGRHLAWVEGRRRVGFWQVQGGKPKYASFPGELRLTHLALAPAGGQALLIDVRGQVGLIPREKRPIGLDLADEKRVCSAAFSPDGRWFALGYQNGYVCLWRRKTGEREIVLPSGRHAVLSLAFSSDGGSLIAATEAGTVNLFTMPHGNRTTWRISDNLTTLVLSPCGGVLAGGTASGQVLLYELLPLPGGPVAAFPAGNEPLRSLAFSPDERLLAVLGADGVLALYDGITGRSIAHLSSPGRPLAWAGFEPGGRLVSATGSGVVLAWSAAWRPPEGRPALADREREQAWAGLAGEDAGKAAAALALLLNDSEPSLAFVKARLAPLRPDANLQARIAAAIRNLDHDDQRKRNEATEELARIGPATEGQLGRIRQDSSSFEVRMRVETLLNILDTRRSPDQQRLRRRVIRLLELWGSPGSRSVLAGLDQPEWTDGFRKRVQAALARLSARSAAHEAKSP